MIRLPICGHPEMRRSLCPRANVWKLVFMASTTRKLVFQKNPRFTGWACTACGWAKPIPRVVESDGEPPRDIETDFANHDCAKHPRQSEDFSQSAARIVRTENK